jgi:hypothetical protein
MHIRSLSRNLSPKFEQEVHDVAPFLISPRRSSILSCEAGGRSAIGVGLRIGSLTIPAIDAKAYE